MTQESDDPIRSQRLHRKRGAEGRFERHANSLSKTSKNTMAKRTSELNNEQITDNPGERIGAGKPGPGRPKGSRNKLSMALREQILASLDGVGGVEYLMRLAIENSSAYAGLLGKVLPSTIQASDSDGGPAKITFERVIVWPDGRREIEGKTPKQLPAPASHSLPSEDIARLPEVGENRSSDGDAV